LDLRARARGATTLDRHALSTKDRLYQRRQALTRRAIPISAGV
jgi:hypothetical protein